MVEKRISEKGEKKKVDLSAELRIIRYNSKIKKELFLLLFRISD